MISLEELLHFDYDNNPILGLSELWDKIPPSNLLVLTGRSIQQLSAHNNPVAYMYDINTFANRGIIKDSVNLKVPSFNDWEVYNIRPLYFNSNEKLKQLLNDLNDVDWENNPKEQLQNLILNKLSENE
jgi:hypothetical protein